VNGILPSGRTQRPRTFCWRPFIAFEDTNLVGNVYFARFVSWQGRCREAFLAEHAPDIVDALAADLRLVTLSVACEFYDELRVFDALEIQMRLEGREGNRVRLGFDYRVFRDGSARLAAQGQQEVACMRQTAAGLVPTDFPPSLAAALEAYAKDAAPDVAPTATGIPGTGGGA
jgi:enediyne biosynthesis thioesterase